MLPFHRTVLLGLLTAASGAFSLHAQTFDSSGNSVLNGAYFIREVMFTQIDATGAIGKAPVSYTHLDVYKRQPLLRSTARRACESRRSRRTTVSSATVSYTHLDVYKRQFMAF